MGSIPLTGSGSLSFGSSPDASTNFLFLFTFGVIELFIIKRLIVRMKTNIERREKILKLRSEGKSFGEISKELNCNKSLVAFYCGKRFDAKKTKEYEDSEKEYEHIVCELVRNSENLNQVCKKLGKRGTNTNYDSIKRIIEKYNLDTSHFAPSDYSNNRIKKYDASEVYCENSKFKNTNSLRKRLFKDGLKEEKCECCGNIEWNGLPIPLQVHHINGNNRDNRLENLQILCPNCHAQTDTYCGKGKHKKEEVRKIRKKRETTIPTIEIILSYFDPDGNFSNAGKRAGVSDNAVRKWCKKRGLPFRTKEMKVYLANN